MTAPPGEKYKFCSAGGEGASYLVRTDGKVDRTSGGKVSKTMDPPPSCKYVAVSAGLDRFCDETSHKHHSAGLREFCTPDPWHCSVCKKVEVRSDVAKFVMTAERPDIFKIKDFTQMSDKKKGKSRDIFDENKKQAFIDNYDIFRRFSEGLAMHNLVNVCSMIVYLGLTAESKEDRTNKQRRKKDPTKPIEDDKEFQNFLKDKEKTRDVLEFLQNGLLPKSPTPTKGDFKKESDWDSYWKNPEFFPYTYDNPNLWHKRARSHLRLAKDILGRITGKKDSKLKRGVITSLRVASFAVAPLTGGLSALATNGVLGLVKLNDLHAKIKGQNIIGIAKSIVASLEDILASVELLVPEVKLDGDTITTLNSEDQSKLNRARIAFSEILSYFALHKKKLGSGTFNLDDPVKTLIKFYAGGESPSSRKSLEHDLENDNIVHRLENLCLDLEEAMRIDEMSGTAEASVVEQLDKVVHAKTKKFKEGRKFAGKWGLAVAIAGTSKMELRPDAEAI